MAKVTLELEYDYDFTLIGVSCHSRDYKFCWLINSFLDLNFTRQDSIQLKTRNITSEFANYTYTDDNSRLAYTLLINRGTQGFLLPEQKQADYLIKIEGGLSHTEEAEIIKNIKKIDVVLTAFIIDVNSLKSKQNLIL